MKQFILLFSTLLSLTLNAQDWTVGSRWLYYQEDYMPDNTDEYMLLEISTDSLIGNDTFLVLDEYYLKHVSGHLKSFYQFTSFIRKTDEKVFVKSNNSSQAFLLYDFSAETGDTMTVMIAGNYGLSDDKFIPVVVDSVKNIANSGGTIRKTQFVHTPYNDWGFSFNHPIISGIGETYYFFPTPGFVDPPPGGSLICFYNNNFSFPPDNQCQILLPAVEVNRTQLKAYPNPVKSLLTIESSDFEHWEIIDLHGIKRLEGDISNQPDVSTLPAGNYFLILYNENALTHIAKIIVTSH